MTDKEIYLLALAALQVADAYTTIKVINAGGRELNPVIKKLMGIFGMLPALVIKGAVVVAVAWLLEPLYVAAIAAVYTVVVVRNWRLMK